MVIAVGILIYFDAIHPSAFYSSRLRLQQILHVDPEDVWGEWKIELPYANFLGTYRMDNWEESRLILCENSDCILIKPTEGMMLPDALIYYSSEELIQRQESIGKILHGKFEFILEGRHPNQRQDENRETNVIEIDCPPFYLCMPILKNPSGTGIDQYRILMGSEFPWERCGIVWKKISNHSLCPKERKEK
jgi:hypothetical protein